MKATTGGHILKPTSCSSTIVNVMSAELRFYVTKLQEVQENEDCTPPWQSLWHRTINTLFPNVQFEPPEPQLAVTASCFTICHYGEGCLCLRNFPSVVPHHY